PQKQLLPLGSATAVRQCTDASPAWRRVRPRLSRGPCCLRRLPAEAAATATSVCFPPGPGSSSRCGLRLGSTLRCPRVLPRRGRRQLHRLPAGGDSVNLMPANQPCQQGADHLQGRCDGTAPVRSLPVAARQLIVRLWRSHSAVWEQLSLNIVFTVVILSLLLWVPACAIIAYQDRIDARKSGDSEADAADIRYSAARPGGSAQGRYFT
uniref:G_PROTEIN_RECEP_F1_2 domain-containing protein n=1 Tax=Macrostomum lignano TaxID=282301 RepID=A0A1I8FKR0_9PLAT